MGNYAKQLQKKQDGMTNENKRQTALESLARLEGQQNQLLTEHNKLVESVNYVHRDIENMVMMIEAMSELLGVDQVADKMKANSVAKLEANVAQSEINFAEAVANGQLEIAEIVSGSDEDLKKFVVCGTIHNKEGEMLHPSKYYRPYATWKESIQKELVDKKVGDKLNLDDGATLTVVQIYKQCEAKAEGSEAKVEEGKQ
jgi:uncharacterized protein YoxC